MTAAKKQQALQNLQRRQAEAARREEVARLAELLRRHPAVQAAVQAIRVESSKSAISGFDQTGLNLLQVATMAIQNALND